MTSWLGGLLSTLCVPPETWGLCNGQGARGEESACELLPERLPEERGPRHLRGLSEWAGGCGRWQKAEN